MDYSRRKILFTISDIRDFATQSFDNYFTMNKDGSDLTGLENYMIGDSLNMDIFYLVDSKPE